MADDEHIEEAVDFDDAPADDVLDEDAEQALPVQVEKTEEASEAPAALAADQQGEEPAVKLEATAVKDEDGNVASAMVDTETPAENGQPIPVDNGTGSAEPSVEDPLSLPPHGCEVFVGGLPRAADEKQLIEFASTIGEVYSCTLLRDPNMPSQNRGFGFVRYKEKAAAANAMEALHLQEMKDFPGFKVRMAPSQAKHKLFVGNIPKAYTQEEVERQLNLVVKGVEAVDLLMSKDFPGQNRGFAFVAFYNHACANAAKNTLGAPGYRMGERQLTVSFAEPKQSEMGPQTPQDKVLYVGGLTENLTEDQIRDCFSQYGEVTRVVQPPPRDGKKREYAFVHFADHSVVEQLISNNDRGIKPEIDGNPLDMKPAKPQVTPDQRQGAYGRGGAAPYGRGGRGAGYPPRGRGSPAGGGYGRGEYGGYDASGYGYGGEYAAGYDAYGGQAAYGSYGDYSGYGYGQGTQGMSMVPMMLPSGQVGYVLQGQGQQQGYGAARGAQGQGSYGGNYSQRYRPY